MTQGLDEGGLNRRTFLRNGSIAAASLYGTTLLSACGSGSDSAGTNGASPNKPATSAGPPQGGTPVRGGSLRVGLTTAGESENIAVPTAILTPDVARVQALYDPLFFVGDYGGYKPGLATEGLPNKDGTKWTLHLRRGVTWHDGKPFNADDVVWTIQRSWGSPENAFNVLLKTIVDFKNVKKIDEYTVEVPLLIPLAEFQQMTSTAPASVVQAGTTNFTKPIGTGPFVYESFVPGVRSVFTANKNYWMHGQPYVDELVIDSSFAEPNTVMNALLSGQIDVMPAAPAALAKANAESGKINVGNIEGPGWCAPLMRVDTAPFKDKNVRAALKLMSDREAIVTSAFDGYGTPGNDCPGATLKYWAKDLKPPQYDPEQAKALLKKAGQEGLNVTLQTSAVLPGVNEMATLFSEQAKSAGATINVQQIEPSQYYSASRYLKRSFGMEIWTAGINSLNFFYLTFLYPGAPFNETYWGVHGQENSNKLLREAIGELDEAKAAEKWHAVQELQYTEGGMLLLANYNWLDAYGTNVRGLKTTNAGQCDNYTFTGGWLES